MNGIRETAPDGCFANKVHVGYVLLNVIAWIQKPYILLIPTTVEFQLLWTKAFWSLHVKWFLWDQILLIREETFKPSIQILSWIWKAWHHPTVTAVLIAALHAPYVLTILGYLLFLENAVFFFLSVLFFIQFSLTSIYAFFQIASLFLTILHPFSTGLTYSSFKGPLCCSSLFLCEILSWYS
jgi:hypothetical protein